MVNLFDNITNKNKEKLLKILESHSISIKRNNTILSTVKTENTIGIIISGIIQIVRNEYNGNRTIIEELNENDIFGSIIFPFSSNEYDMITKEDSKILIIEFDRILDTTDTNYFYYNQFIKNLLQILSDKIREKNERIEILTKKTIRDKLLEYFNIYSRKHGTHIIYLPFSLTDFADYLAVDRSAMSRELKNLKDEGFIEQDGRKIVLKYRKR